MAFVNVKLVKRSAKFLILGPDWVGKSYAGLQMEAPIGAFDAADGLRAFRDSFDFGLEAVTSLDDLGARAEALVAPNGGLDQVETVLVDGLQILAPDALGPDGQPTAAWRRVERSLCQIGARGKHVWATWRAATKADVPESLWGGFDLVGFLEMRDGARVLTVLKSRFPRSLPAGEKLHGFDPRVSFRAILDDAAQSQEEDGVAAEMRLAREQIKERLRVLSAKNGGSMPEDDVKRLWGVAGDAASSLETLGEALAEMARHTAADGRAGRKGGAATGARGVAGR